MNATKKKSTQTRTALIWLAALLWMCSAGWPVALAQSESNAEQKEGDQKSPPNRAPRKGAQRTARGQEAQPADTPADELAEALAQAQQNEQGGEAQIDPELQKRIDELLKKAAAAEQPTQQPAGGEVVDPRERLRRMREQRQQPGAVTPDPDQSAETPAGEEGPSLNIEPASDGVPPEARTYRFSIKDGTYDQLVEGFARQTGLGVIGDAPRDGKVTFVTTEELSFNEALSRVRMLLFNYKPHDPYWLERRESHLAVVRVADFYRIMPLDRMFKSLEEYRSAHLPDDELVLVIYTPTVGSISDLSEVRDFMPDYMRVTPLLDTNSVTIFGLVKDIEKYMSLINIFVLGGKQDPRATAKIEVINILPSEALEKLRQLTELDQIGGQPRPRAIPGGRRGAEPSVLDNVPEPAVVLIPEDTQGYIIARAMQDKIDEIRALLPIVDVPTPVSDRIPVVVPLKFAQADQLVTTLQQVLMTTSAASATGAPSTPRRPRRTPSAASGPVSADSVTLLPHPSMNAIVVMADSPEQVQRVRELITLFDIKARQRIRIELTYADPTEVTNTILAVLAGGAKQSPADVPQVVPDPSGGAIYFTGSQSALEDVQTVIASLDVPSEPVTLHVFPLKNRLPSFVANILREYDNAIPQPQSAGAQRARGTSSRPASRRARKSPPVASKFTADDDEMRLLVLCTEPEWLEYIPIIEKLENSVDAQPPFVRLELANMDPAAAIESLGMAFAGAPGAVSSLRFLPADGAILVIDAAPAELERVRALLAEFDTPVVIEQRIFEIKYKDPSEIHQAIEALIATPTATPSNRSSVRRRLPGAKDVTGPAGISPTQTESMTIIEMGNKLIVRAAPAVLDEVASLIAQFDVEEVSAEMRVFGDFPPGTDIVSLSDTVKTVVSGGGISQQRRAVRSGQPDAPGGDVPRFVPYPPSGKLIVIAEPSMFPDIEQIINLFKSAANAPPIEVSFVKLEYADPDSVIELIGPLLDMQIRRLVQTGEMDAVVDATAQSMPGTKRRTGRMPSGAGNDKYHLAADVANSRIVIAAQRSIIDLAASLIKQFDFPIQTDEIVFETVTLNNADPVLMVKAVKEMVGTGGVRRRVTTPSAAGVPEASTPPLTVAEAPTGGAIVLRGTKTDVEEAVVWINHLDSMSTAGQLVRVFEIKTADIKKLVELILHMVDTAQAQRTPTRAPAPPRRPSGLAGILDDSGDDDAWETSKTWTGQDLFIQADLIDKTMLVATTESKMSRIESLIKQVDEDPAIQTVMVKNDAIPSFAYELQYADSLDAVWDADEVFDELFYSDQRPKVKSAFFGDNTIIVEYPDKSRFDELKELIVTYIDKLPKEDRELKTKSWTPPEGLNAEQTVIWLKMNHPEVQIELIDTSEVPKEYDIEEIAPRKSEDDRRSAIDLPHGPLGRFVGCLVMSVLAQQEDEPAQDPPAEEDADLEPIEDMTPPPDDLQDDMIQRAVEAQMRAMAAQQNADPGTMATETDAEKRDRKREDGVRLPPEEQKLQILYDKNKGVFVVKGPKALVEEVDDWMDDLKDEVDKFPVMPDIRIYRVRYIDVFTAQDIIEEMFNATKQQRNMVQQQAQMMQQQARLRQQQMAQQRAQQLQQQQQQQQAPAGRGQQPGGRPGQEQDQQQPEVQAPQLPPTSVRVYPNPRDRTLIFRADTSQYPAILELLAKIDQPKPFDSELKIFPLEKLNAADVADTLRDLLNLDSGSSGGSSATPARRGRAAAQQSSGSTAPGEQLPKTILQDVTGGTGTLSVDPEDITLSSNEESNSIVVMAPPAAIELIGELIKQLESEDIPTRETRSFELKHADAEETLEYLTSYFAEQGRSTQARPGGRRSAKGGDSSAVSTGDDMRSPTFIAYPRLNMLTVQAPANVLDEVADLIAQLDVSSAQDQWADIVLNHADANLVADTLGQMFGEGGGASPRRGSGGGGASSSADTGPKFIGEEGGRVVLYRAPETLKPQIIEAVAKLEESAKQTSGLHVMTLEHATASRVAEAIDSAYGASRGGSGGGRRGSTTATQFSVTAHDPTRQLLIRSDEAQFKEIESLVKTLDVPGGLGFEFRIYPLQYANARDVYTTMSQLVQGYLKQLGPAAQNMEPFSVEVNDAANALVVLGGPQIFEFFKENLKKIDTKEAAELREVQVVTLLTADATAVAKTLTDIFITGAGSGAKPGAPGGAPPISISAVQGSPTILVRCSKATFAEMEPIIKQLDSEDAAAGEVRVVSLLYSDATEMNKALQDTLQNPNGGSGGRGGQELIGGVRVSALPQSNALVISGGKEQVENLETTIRALDAVGEKGSVPQIIILKHAKVANVLPTLLEMVGKDTRGKGGQPAPILAANDPLNALVVRASQSDMAWIEGMIAKIDDENYPVQPGIRVVQLQQGLNLNDLAEKVEGSVNKVAEQLAASSGGKTKAGSVSVTPDSRTNSLIIAGDPSLFSQAEDLARTMEKMGPSGGRETRIIAVKNVEIDEIERLISQLTGQDASGGSSSRGSSSSTSPRPRRTSSGGSRRP